MSLLLWLLLWVVWFSRQFSFVLFLFRYSLCSSTVHRTYITLNVNANAQFWCAVIKNKTTTAFVYSPFQFIVVIMLQLSDVLIEELFAMHLATGLGDAIKLTQFIWERNVRLYKQSLWSKWTNRFYCLFLTWFELSTHDSDNE